jgi:hypothetical protein
MPSGGSDWDVDCSWSALYGSTLRPSQRSIRASRRRVEGSRREARKEFYRCSRRIRAQGGWGYYEGVRPCRDRPTESNELSRRRASCPALFKSQKLEWGVDRKSASALHYVARCALPNGAYEYDLNPIPRISGGEMINNVKGSLGRIQVCNWARRNAGDKAVTDEKIREGLKRFFDDHMFLDVARLKPIRTKRITRTPRISICSRTATPRSASTSCPKPSARAGTRACGRS